MPAARLFLLLGGISVLLIGSAAEPWLAMVTLVLDALVVAAFCFDLLRARRARLGAERRWPPMLTQGWPADVEVEVVTRGDRPLAIRLREGLHPALAPRPLRTEVALRPRSRAVWRYRLTPRQRGDVECLPLTARILGPWKLAWSQRELLPPEPSRIYPQVRWEGQVGHLLALAQRHQLGAMPLRWQGIGTEPYALREYLRGDPPNKIHWKATARHGRLVSREETWERGARLIIMLDCARTMTSREGDRSKLDYSLAAALALTRVASARGDRVTLMAFAEGIQRVVRVGSGSQGLSRAYRELYDLQARRTEPAYDLAAERAYHLESRSATVVLFTSVVDLAAAELLRESVLRLERRHRPMLINLQDPELQNLAVEAPESAEQAFGQVSALEILLANEALAKQLRRAGVRVVNTPADRLALEALEAYLALFRNQERRRGVA